MDRLNQHTQKVEPESLWALLLRHEDKLRKWTLWPGLAAAVIFFAAEPGGTLERIAMPVLLVCGPVIVVFRYVDAYRYLRVHGGKVPNINWKKILLIVSIVLLLFVVLAAVAAYLKP
jgi:hypothetical protein